MTLLKEYYSVAMLICWYTMSSVCLSYYVGQFMLVSIKCIQPVQFDSVHATRFFFFFFFFFPTVFRLDSSDMIRLLVSFVGRGARLWRHPG